MSSNKQEKQLRVAFYLRVSTDEQAEKYGKDLHKSAIEAYVASRGKLDDGVTDAVILKSENHIYVDEGISGTLPLEERPAFSRLMEDIRNSNAEERPFDIVAVYKIDRFARRLKILLDTIDFFNDHDIQIISTKETIDTSTPFGRAILGIVGVLAELEMETIKQRTHEGIDQARKAGVFMGSVPPYGYIKNANKQLIVLEEEANVVRKIFDMYLLESMGVLPICRELQNLKIYSPSYSAFINHKNNRKRVVKKQSQYFWNASMVKTMLTDEIYIGNYYHSKNKDKKSVVKSAWVLSPYRPPSIIDHGTFLKVGSLLELSLKKHEAKINKIGIESKNNYLLSGILKCASCFDEERDAKEGMQSWYGERREIELADGTKKMTYFYRCRRKNTGKTEFGCHTIPLPADQIEDYVVERIKELLKDPQTVYNYQQNLTSVKQHLASLRTSQTYIEKSLNAYPSRIARLKEQNIEGYITLEELKIQLADQEVRKKTDETKLDALKTRIAQQALSEGYIKCFELFKQKYEKMLYTETVSRESIQKIIKLLVGKIVIYSRALTPKDKVAGKKALNQEIPYRIDIVFKLPSEYLLLLKDEVDKRVIEEVIPLPISPEKITDADLEVIGMTREEYADNYEITLKEFQLQYGDKKFTW